MSLRTCLLLSSVSPLMYSHASRGILAKLAFPNTVAVLSGKAEYWLRASYNTEWTCGAHSRRDHQERMTVPLKKCHHPTISRICWGSVVFLKWKWLFVDEHRGDGVLPKGHPSSLCRCECTAGAYCRVPCWFMVNIDVRGHF